MFERYTERARRVIFFARYSASEFGSMTIETEHLLLAMLREDPNLIPRFLPSKSTGGIRKEVEDHLTVKPKVSTSVDMPLSLECQRILAYAAEEAERLRHRHISADHLLLGVLREQGSAASQILHAAGFDLAALREQLALQEERTAEVSIFALPKNGCVPDANVATTIAIAVWLPLYGSDIVNSQQPFSADLTDETWIVRGTVSNENPFALIAHIAKADARIFKVGQQER